ncbi:hypothetical protein CDAR_508551 [Caerostris darwini]|uniref:Uncharacterized protein n=1 Tax=Caerostris darwini TaxID=1538125 RepID=A0AAV4N000_9ARAC|nr:hypothetical protein CDAR_508551 [Caerostris darwini]
MRRVRKEKSENEKGEKKEERKKKETWQQPKSQSIARTTKPSAIAKTRVTSGVITGRLRFLSRRLFFLSFSQSCSSRKFITREREKRKHLHPSQRDSVNCDALHKGLHFKKHS